MAAVFVAGGVLTALILFGRAPGSELIVLLLKAIGIATYVGIIGLGIYLWREGQWAVVALPPLMIATQVLVVIAGNNIVNWGFPIWPGP